MPFFATGRETRDFAQGAEELGYDTLNFSEHVAATRDSAFPPGFSFEDCWHEAFTQAAFLSAVTDRIELSTSMALLALRPTVLAAKQAAEVALLSGGRLRLGVSIGWNVRETESVGQDSTVRGAKLEEQVAVLRMLWTQPAVSFIGRFHRLSQVGISPRPLKPIPIWLGAGSFQTRGVPSDLALRRIVRVADGYKMMAPLGLQPRVALDVVERLRRLADESGRDRASIGIEARLLTQVTPREEWRSAVDGWARCGIDYVSLGNRIIHNDVDVQLRALQQFIAVVRG